MTGSRVGMLWWEVASGTHRRHRRESTPTGYTSSMKQRRDTPAHTGDFRAALLTAATALLLGLVLVRMVIVISPRIYWDVSPLMSQAEAELPATTLGPAGAAWLDVASLVVAGLAMVAHGLACGRINWLIVGLWLAGCVTAGWHAVQSVADAWQASAWIAATALALAGAHLAQHRASRRFMVAGLMAMILPLALAAVLYVSVEHARTVAFFTEREAETIAQRGWAWESTQHLIYRRRLLTPEVTGAFGLSNVMGSIVGAMTLLAGVTAAAGLWRRVRNPWAWAAAGLALAGMMTVLSTRSKGAILALMLAGVLPLLIAWLRRGPAGRWRRRLPGVVALLLVAAAIGVVLVRGAMGPPADASGERSLLFRFHYWQGAAAIVADQPLPTQAMGIGPAAFKPLYSLHKNPINPEDVTSTHNVVVDFVVMLGLGGLAWVVLMLRHLWRAGLQSLPDADADEHTSDAADDGVDSDDASSDLRQHIWPAILLAALVFAPQYWLKLPEFLPETVILWLVGVVGFVVIVVGLSHRRIVDEAWVHTAMFSAAAMLLIHNQIEMSFFHPSAAVPAWFMLGIAGGSRHHAPGSGHALHAPQPQLRQRATWLSGVPAAIMLIGAVVLAVGYASPLTDQQDAMRRAVAAVVNRDMPNALRHLRQAQDLMPSDPLPVQAQVELLAARAHWLKDAPPDQHTQTQLKQTIDEALAVLGQAFERGLDTVQLRQMQAQLLEFAAQATQSPLLLGQAATAWGQIIARQPHSVPSRVALADVLWELGRHEEARKVYSVALALSDNAYLDPLAQLTATQRQRITDRLE